MRPTRIKGILIMEQLILLPIAIGLAAGVGYLGSKRKIGFGWAFAISLFNVIIGLIVVLCSKKLKDVNTENINNEGGRK